jgi:hypothetical protein
MNKPRLCIGVPFYGPTEPTWWIQFAGHVSELHNTVDLVDGWLLAVGSMAADHNRNLIVEDFLKTDAEWLFWIDADTIVPIGSLNRLLAMGKTLASGVYYGKNPPHPPIAYYKYNGAFIPIDKQTRWEKGEIIPVDAAGLGCMLTHRSVYEDIREHFQVLQQAGGSLTAVHDDDIVGAITAGQVHRNDEKVINGRQRRRLIPPTIENWHFPYFALEHGRTEDLWFFDMAARVGHKAWLDTSIEALHLRTEPFTGKMYRELVGA